MCVYAYVLVNACVCVCVCVCLCVCMRACVRAYSDYIASTVCSSFNELADYQISTCLFQNYS